MDAGYKNATCKSCGMYEKCQTPFMPCQTMVAGAKPKIGESILVVGEAPGRNEDIDGIPFHPDGASGEMLRKELRRHRIDGDVIFSNAVRCRPQDNKTPTPKLIKTCKVFLQQEIEFLRPKAILMVGGIALTSLTGKGGITNKRRTVIQYTLQDGSTIPMMAAFHPSFCLRDMNNYPEFQEDIRQFVRFIKGKVKDPKIIEDELMGKLVLNAQRSDVVDFHKSLLKSRRRMGWDVETNSLYPYQCADFRITMVSMSDGETTLVVKLDNKDYLAEEKRSKVLRAVLDLLTDPNVYKVGHNVNYDMHCMWRRHKIVVGGVVGDTMIQHALLNPINTSHALEDLSRSMLGVSSYHAATNTKVRGRQNKELMWLLLADDKDLLRRAGLDAACTWHIDRLLGQQMVKEDEYKATTIPEHLRKGYDIVDIYNKITIPSMHVLWEMERNGFPVDINKAHELEVVYVDRLAKLTKKLAEMPKVAAYIDKMKQDFIESPKGVKSRELRIIKSKKVQFKPKSPSQVADVLHLFYKIPVRYLKITKTGKISVDSECIDNLKKTKYYKRCKLFIKRVLRHRHLSKGHGTYIKGILKHVDEFGLIHSRFRQDVAKTGRLSSRAPNLQNLSKRHMDLREMYVAPEGWMMLEADYSQIELRLLAAESGDKTMLSTYIEGRDLHAETAREVWNILADQPIPDEIRTAAKRVNFGIVYLISAIGLMRQIGGTEEDCQLRIDRTYKRFPGVKRWQRNTEKFAEQYGRVYSIFGHWRDVKSASSKPMRGESEGWAAYQAAKRQAVNAPIQGAAGFMMLVSLVKLNKEIKKRKLTDSVKLVNTIHDSLIVLCKKEKYQEVKKLVVDVMEQEPVRWLKDDLRGVPIKVDVKAGTVWAKLEKAA